MKFHAFSRISPENFSLCVLIPTRKTLAKNHLNRLVSGVTTYLTGDTVTPACIYDVTDINPWLFCVKVG